MLARVLSAALLALRSFGEGGSVTLSAIAPPGAEAKAPKARRRTWRAVALAEAEAFPVEVEVNSGRGNTTVVIIMSISPILKLLFLLAEQASSSVKSEDTCMTPACGLFVAESACQKCSNGWISLLENEVKPLVSPRRRDGLRTELSIIPK
jgi:hypothetical protein